MWYLAMTNLGVEQSCDWPGDVISKLSKYATVNTIGTTGFLRVEGIYNQ